MQPRLPGDLRMREKNAVYRRVDFEGKEDERCGPGRVGFRSPGVFRRMKLVQQTCTCWKKWRFGRTKCLFGRFSGLNRSGFVIYLISGQDFGLVPGISTAVRGSKNEGAPTVGGSRMPLHMQTAPAVGNRGRLRGGARFMGNERAPDTARCREGTARPGFICCLYRFLSSCGCPLPQQPRDVMYTRSTYFIVKVPCPGSQNVFRDAFLRYANNCPSDQITPESL